MIRYYNMDELIETCNDQIGAARKACIKWWREGEEQKETYCFGYKMFWQELRKLLRDQLGEFIGVPRLTATLLAAQEDAEALTDVSMHDAIDTAWHTANFIIGGKCNVLE